MRSLLRLGVVASALTIFSSLGFGVRLDSAFMSKSPSDDQCNPGSPVTTFLTTDAKAWLYVSVSQAQAGDLLRVEWGRPDGQLYYTSVFNALPASGAYCFDAGVSIAGTAAASAPGAWTVRGSWSGSSLFTLTFTLATPGSGGTALVVDSRANIFASGRAAAFNGVLPPSYRFTPAAGKAVTFSSVTGSVACMTSASTNGPDGSTSCAGGSTNINSYNGISGIIHGRKAMFLVGVFLDDSEPRSPAPARLDFTNNESFTSISPLIGQSFFVGDGLTGTGAGSRQQFNAPATATRLFLGFADAWGFQGDPGAYDDNVGSLTATFEMGAGSVATCSYSVSPLSQSISGSGGSGQVAVTTASGCAWTATSNANWITITAGSSGAGNGTVSYTAASNPSSSPRTSTLTIAGQTHTVNQQAGAASCSYSITPTSASVAGSGGTGGVVVTSPSGCSWTATSNTAWISITSGSSGAGNGTVGYSAAANPTTAPRTGTLTIVQHTFTLNQGAGSAAAGAPAISAGGITNAASFMRADHPAGGIARGSIFSIFGTGLGPPQYAQASSFPISSALSGVSVRVTQGSTSVDAYPLFVSAGQINAIMPSNAPLGNAEIRVTYANRTSAAAAIKIVSSNFGAFSTANGAGPGIIQNYVSPAEQPLNTISKSARPTQVEILWGTGLGPISAPDNMAPPAGDLPVPVEILVGGKPAKKLYSGRTPCCSGVDQIVFEVPADVPQGCYVPVQVRVGDSSFSNVVRMAIDSQGQRCQDPVNPYSSLAAAGGKTGSIVLVRAGVYGQLESGKPPVDLTVDAGLGAFYETKAGGELAFSSLYNLPPPGTCTSTAGALDVNSLLGSATNLPTDSPTSRELDAGPQLTIRGPRGTMPLPHLDSKKNSGPYLALLGGTIPLEGSPSLPLFLEGGSYTISGPGGKDVGPFTVNLTLPSPVVWTNRDQINAVDRSAGVTLTWSGGNASQLIIIAGGNLDQKTEAAGGFLCLVSAGDRTFAVPRSVLAGIPPTAPSQDPEDSLGGLALGTLLGDLPKFTASGLDAGYVVYGVLQAKTLTYR